MGTPAKTGESGDVGGYQYSLNFGSGDEDAVDTPSVVVVEGTIQRGLLQLLEQGNGYIFEDKIYLSGVPYTLTVSRKENIKKDSKTKKVREIRFELRGSKTVYEFSVGISGYNLRTAPMYDKDDIPTEYVDALRIDYINKLDDSNNGPRYRAGSKNITSFEYFSYYLPRGIHDTILLSLKRVILSAKS